MAGLGTVQLRSLYLVFTLVAEPGPLGTPGKDVVKVHGNNLCVWCKLVRCRTSLLCRTGTVDTSSLTDSALWESFGQGKLLTTNRLY